MQILVKVLLYMRNRDNFGNGDDTLSTIQKKIIINIPLDKLKSIDAIKYKTGLALQDQGIYCCKMDIVRMEIMDF